MGKDRDLPFDQQKKKKLQFDDPQVNFIWEILVVMAGCGVCTRHKRVCDHWTDTWQEDMRWDMENAKIYQGQEQPNSRETFTSLGN
ncbi:hypothetical protein CY35_02G197900 [Sphagnum magellanicum]|jgi:hypothetical protein|nr:hypothetical protein CY35_02G197900 [Sphagnum magellanicum]